MNETGKTAGHYVDIVGAKNYYSVDPKGENAETEGQNRFNEPVCPENHLVSRRRSLSSAVEHHVDIVGVSGSIPLATTIHKVLIGVCTYKRPLMLAKCLTSLANQDIAENMQLHLVVVDNEPGAPRQADVLDFAERCPFPVHYRHEPKRGIAAARNAVLDTALTLDVDWIAFIDDDEVAKLDWIVQLMHEDYHDVPVLRGLQRFVYPMPRPFWVLEKTVSAGREGQGCKTATTNNVRISANIVRSGYRFDETLGLMGGEDHEFFSRLHAAGWQIKRTLRAVTFEKAHSERLTWLGQAYRAYWCAASDTRGLAISRGWFGTLLRKGHTIPLHVVVGALWLLASPIALPFSRHVFKVMALSGGRTAAKGLGRGAAIIGVLPQPYRVTVGS